MAEIGLAIFGGIAGANTLVGQLITLSRSLHKMVKAMRSARRDITKMADGMSIFAELFNDFLEVCPTDSENKESFSPSSLILWVKKALRGLEILRKKVEPLLPRKHDDYSFIEKLIAHVAWYLNKSSVKAFRASLCIARESMNGYTNILHIKKLNELLRKIQNMSEADRQATEEQLGMPLEECVKELKKKM